jgi:hypothetical protein
MIAPETPTFCVISHGNIIFLFMPTFSETGARGGAVG